MKKERQLSENFGSSYRSFWVYLLFSVKSFTFYGFVFRIIPNSFALYKLQELYSILIFLKIQ